MHQLVQDERGQVLDTHSVSAGLDYPGVGPEHSYLKDAGRAEYVPCTDAEAMEAFALPIFRAGHIPVVGEWLALPLADLAGSRVVGDAAFDEVFHPIAVRLLARCDAVLRMGGASQGADQMVAVAREHGLAVYTSLAEVPGCSA